MIQSPISIRANTATGLFLLLAAPLLPPSVVSAQTLQGTGLLITGDATVTGNATLLNSSVQNQLNSFELTVTGSSTFIGGMTALGQITVQASGGLDVRGPLSVAANATTTLDGPVQINGTLEATSSFAAAMKGGACIGSGCNSLGPLPDAPLLVKDTTPGIEFSGNGPDWDISINAGSIDSFAIREGSGSFPTAPFTIESGAPENSLWIAADGRIGLGTTLPQADFHVVSGDSPAIMLQQLGGFGNQGWELIGNEAGFFVRNSETAGLPFAVDPGAPGNALRIAGGGDIGLGTSAPSAPLHIIRSNGNARILLEDSSPGVQEMFAMRNHGGSYFTLDNTQSGTTWFFTHENSAPNRFIIADAVADGPEMSLTADGVLTVPGGFVVGSTALNVPDYVFEPEYDLKPLSEVSAFIAEQGHLPDVPSAAEVEDQGLDMARMQMALLKKVEELTLYTLAQEVELTRLRALEARLEALEAR
ncbi:hypothetical protein [Primorskyibacter sp. 2E233]|uniref:hypothetical protein n=1 Tax=Primorskyibacter sp. 2E233 TaxID=3413431 RepID=UPI003BF42E6A